MGCRNLLDIYDPSGRYSPFPTRLVHQIKNLRHSSMKSFDPRLLFRITEAHTARIERSHLYRKMKALRIGVRE